MRYQELAKLHQLHEGYRQVFRLGGREWLLLHLQGQTYVIANRCPHLGAPLQGASLVEHERGLALRCPRHGMVFDLDSGCALAGDCEQRLEFLPLVYQGNGLGVYSDS